MPPSRHLRLRSTYEAFPAQAIITLVRLRTFPTGSMARTIVDMIFTPNALSGTSIFQNMSAENLGIADVQRWQTEAMSTLPTEVRSWLAERLAHASIEDLVTIITEAPPVIRAAQAGPTIFEALLSPVNLDGFGKRI